MPLAFAAGVHRSVSLAPSSVVPAVTATHVEPPPFSKVPVLTVSIRKDNPLLSTSASSAAAASAAYVIS